MTMKELKAVQQRVGGLESVTLCFQNGGQSVKYMDDELKGISYYAVTTDFDRIQNIEIQEGRYLSTAELDGGTYSTVIGDEVFRELFPGSVTAIGKSVTMNGRKFVVVGILKKTGQNMAGFNFDNCVIIPYIIAPSMTDVESLNFDPTLMVKAKKGLDVNDLKYEVEGVLRSTRKVAPGMPDDFAINQLSQVATQINAIFSVVKVVGWIIGGFSLLVGCFGIANIMFVTVKERTKFIGLKKAIGARPRIILIEFLLEAVVLCLIGGVIGIIIVFLLSLAMTYGLDFPVTLSFENFFIGISVSAVVGVIAGYIPARAASRLDPVVAIRST